MLLRFRSITLAFFALTVLLSACGNSPTQTFPTPTPSTTTNGIVPDSLAMIEAQAEDIIDVVPNAEWSQVNTDIARIEQAWTTYQPQAVKDGAPQAAQAMFSQALSRLKSAATAQDATGTLQAANDLSAAVITMFDLYHPVIPTDIGRLDVLERQIILDVANQDLNAATATLMKIKTMWEQVKPSVLTHNGQSVMEQFTHSLALQDKALEAKDRAALTDEAKNGLEIVDALERLY